MSGGGGLGRGGGYARLCREDSVQSDDFGGDGSGSA